MMYSPNFICRKALVKIFVFISFFLYIPVAQSAAILHAFNWTYEEVGNRAAEIANLGYKKVLVAPPLKSNRDNCAWWARYQPQDYRVIDHCLGNTESFKNMITALSANNVETYADVVINQMANERFNSVIFPGQEALNDYAQSSEYWQRQRLFGDLANGLFDASDFHSEFCISSYNDWYQSMNGRICGAPPDRGLPDMSPNNWVRQQHRNYLQALKDMGVTGFRVDAAKHMEIWHINAIFTAEIKRGMHVFGEIIVDDRAGQNASYDKFLQPYLQNTDHSAYDFPLFKTIREAFAPSGSLTALTNPVAWGGAISGPRAVTFAITHDIPTNDGFRYQIMNPRDEHLAYAFILGRQDGAPLILSDKTGVGNGRWFDDYKQQDIVAMLNFHNRVDGESQEVLHADDCSIIFRRGKQGLVGINKCGQEKTVDINTHDRFLWFRNYVDTFSNEQFNITNGNLTVRIPSRSARMWYVD